MKLYIVATSIFLFILSNACEKKPINKDKGLLDRNMALLDSLTPFINYSINCDTSRFFLSKQKDDGAIHLIVGESTKKGKVHAIYYSEVDSLIYFYCYEKLKWESLGSIKPTIYDIYTLEFEELDGDDRFEIVASTHYNINANSWKDIFYCSHKSDSIKYAGSFSTEYNVRKHSKTIEVTYGGSWYTNNSKTIYKWYDERLIPIKEAVLKLKEVTFECHDYIVEYYENTTNKKDSLTLILEKPYVGKNKKIWDEFYEWEKK